MTKNMADEVFRLLRSGHLYQKGANAPVGRVVERGGKWAVQTRGKQEGTWETLLFTTSFQAGLRLLWESRSAAPLEEVPK